ncbi:MAG: hypothetical protein ACYCSF_02400 [Acidimicrobiales bacterium]
MPDIRRDFNRTAQDLTRVAQDAAYVAVGLGVVGFQKTQVARRELVEQIEKQRAVVDVQAAEVRAQLARTWRELDNALGQIFNRADATLAPVTSRLPLKAQALVSQARETRDQVRELIADQLAA